MGRARPTPPVPSLQATTSVDFTADQTFTIKLKPINGDTAELTDWTLLMYPGSDTPTNVAPATATAMWAHSLGAGAGATAPGINELRAGTSSNGSQTVTMPATGNATVGLVLSGPGIPAGTIITKVTANTSLTISKPATAAAGAGNFVFTGGPMPDQVMFAEPGRPVANLGVGGETSAQIKTRFLRDKIRGKKWTCVFWPFRNDSWSTPQGRADAVANLAVMVARLDAGVKYVVCTEITSQAETTGSANNTAVLALNDLIRAAYPSNYVDTFAALCTDNGRPPLSYAQSVTTTGTYTSGSPTVTVALATSITNGMYAIAPGNDGIPDRTTCTISGTTVTLAANSTAAGTATMVSFIDPAQVHLNDLGYSVAAAAILTKLQATGG
jgi:hypothetical protein